LIFGVWGKSKVDCFTGSVRSSCQKRAGKELFISKPGTDIIREGLRSVLEGGAARGVGWRGGGLASYNLGTKSETAVSKNTLIRPDLVNRDTGNTRADTVTGRSLAENFGGYLGGENCGTSVKELG